MNTAKIRELSRMCGSYQCVLTGEDLAGSATQVLRILEYLEVRLALEILNFVRPRFQFPVLEDRHKIGGWGG